MRVQLVVTVVILFVVSIASVYFWKYRQSKVDPLLAVLIMVKNEESVMRATLEPFLKAGVDSYLILDTGSTDNTVAVTQQLFAEYNVKHGYIEQKQFVDFATSRNHAIEFAEKYFPHAGFFLMIDAEWYTEGVSELLNFCQANKDSWENVYLTKIRIDSSNFEFYNPRLFKPNRNIRFTGVVHEVLNEGAYLKAPDELRLIYRPASAGRDKSSKRWVRDKKLLLAEAEKDPTDCRTLFYLGQTCDCLGDNNDAITWYKKRCDIQGWDEENFMAHYRLAQVYGRLHMWDQAKFFYMKAYTLKPTRAEPLIRLAEHYLEIRDYRQSYIFARCAAEMPYPEHDVLFIEKELYDHLRYDILAKVAQHVGEYEAGRDAALKLVDRNPNNKRLIAQLQFYESKTQ